MFRLLNITIFSLFVLSCGHQQEDQVLSQDSGASEKLTDQTLLTAHHRLYTGVEVGGCMVQTSKVWNGLRHSLGVTFEYEDTGEHSAKRLDFATSNHITSRVRIKRYLFSRDTKSIVFEKVNILEVPMTPKFVVGIYFSKRGVAQKIESRTYVGSAWNLKTEKICEL